MRMADWKHVPSTVVIGRRGLPVVTRGYVEISGIRIYDDEIVIGPRGEPVFRPGGIEPA
jgi:hypothetical protein